MAELPPIRRIVTMHNEQGIAVVQSDEHFPTKPMSAFPGAKSLPIWTSNGVPAKDNNDPADGATRRVTGPFGVVAPGATFCNYTELAPGAEAPWHRTPSLDHNVLISGKLILMMEDGSEYLISKPGDVVIQKGTMHAWRNPGPEVARWVCVLVDAEPAVVDGKEKGASTVVGF
ncbi:hypothetical protein BDY19DRAFT_914952 [Irpex rosettiformis]|uniref:Uncharacterized protein n=1 Tax=Irpex rosettiformis TaxID=378272 RepID=A0ACB8UM45_9APHY|nr:hypothetical protein BDY19DRAFT_914952 [Irpex rosettiformis]